ncbi:MAG: enoyl-CoA hydratase/isomerase family protein [Planctomycetota bacterium]|nr:MAG: enoyl-CoA hydratase/isomerase family protein [Planctomycetota bacterium]
MNAPEVANQGPLRLERRADGLLEAVLCAPPLNEIGTELLMALEDLAETLRRDDGVRGLLLCSTLAGGFSAGADLRALSAAIEARGHEAVAGEVRAFLERVRDCFCALEASPKPVVGAVHGVVFGGGFELALCCDLIVAERSARFAFPELRLGLVPGFGGTVRLRRAAGGALLRELLLSGSSLSAERARAVGLVNQVVGEGRARAVARRALEQLLRLDPHALAAAKRLSKPACRAELDEELELFCSLFARPEVARALAEFARRKDPLPYLPRPRGP